jgi:hypothetical protein
MVDAAWPKPPLEIKSWMDRIVASASKSERANRDVARHRSVIAIILASIFAADEVAVESPSY